MLELKGGDYKQLESEMVTYVAVVRRVVMCRLEAEVEELRKKKKKKDKTISSDGLFSIDSCLLSRIKSQCSKM